MEPVERVLDAAFPVRLLGTGLDWWGRIRLLIDLVLVLAAVVLAFRGDPLLGIAVLLVVLVAALFFGGLAIESEGRAGIRRVEERLAQSESELKANHGAMPIISEPAIVGPAFGDGVHVYELDFRNLSSPPNAPTATDVQAAIELVDDDGKTGRRWVAEWIDPSAHSNDMGPLDKTVPEIDIHPGHIAARLPVALLFSEDKACFLWSVWKYARHDGWRVKRGTQRFRVLLKGAQVAETYEFLLINEEHEFKVARVVLAAP